MRSTDEQRDGRRITITLDQTHRLVPYTHTHTQEAVTVFSTQDG